MGWNGSVQAIIRTTIFPALSPQPSMSGLLWSIPWWHVHPHVCLTSSQSSTAWWWSSHKQLLLCHNRTTLSILQSLATSKGSSCKRTKLESLNAFLWKMVAKIAVMEDENQNICKMGTVVDERKWLSNDGKVKETMIASYFENVLSIPFGKKTINELKEKPLSWVVLIPGQLRIHPPKPKSDIRKNGNL